MGLGFMLLVVSGVYLRTKDPIVDCLTETGTNYGLAEGFEGAGNVAGLVEFHHKNNGWADSTGLAHQSVPGSAARGGAARCGASRPATFNRPAGQEWPTT